MRWIAGQRNLAQDGQAVDRHALLTALSRATVTSTPALLVPSPETSITRRAAWKGLRAELRHGILDRRADGCALHEQAGSRQNTLCQASASCGTANRHPIDDHSLRASSRPFHEADGDPAGRNRFDGSDHLRIGQRGGIPFALQLEFACCRGCAKCRRPAPVGDRPDPRPVPCYGRPPRQESASATAMTATRRLRISR